MKRIDPEKTSATVSIRVQLRNIAIINSWLISNGLIPSSGATGISEMVRISAEYILASGKGRDFTALEAEQFLISNGLDLGVKKNKRVLLQQQYGVGADRASFKIDPEDMKKLQDYMLAQEKVKIKEDIAECTVPPSTDQLLSELEKGAPNVVQTQGGEG